MMIAITNIMSHMNVKITLILDSCERFYYPGYFSKEELREETQEIDERIELQEPLRKSNWHFYIQKIKRSCRYHEIDYPDWINLDYHY